MEFRKTDEKRIHRDVRIDDMKVEGVDINEYGDLKFSASEQMQRKTEMTDLVSVKVLSAVSAESGEEQVPPGDEMTFKLGNPCSKSPNWGSRKVNISCIRDISRKLLTMKVGDTKTVMVKPPHGDFVFAKDANVPSFEKVVLRVLYFH